MENQKKDTKQALENLSQLIRGVTEAQGRTASLPEDGVESQEVERLAETVSQELSDLLTAIIGNCELILKNKEKTDPIFKVAQTVKTAAQHAFSLNNELRLLSQKNPLEPTPTDPK